MEWLDESEKTLDSEVEIANDPDKIKTQLVQHKVTQHRLIALYWEKRMRVKTTSEPLTAEFDLTSNRNNICIQNLFYKSE